MALDPAVASAVWGEGVGSGVACLCALGTGLPGVGARRGPHMGARRGLLQRRARGSKHRRGRSALLPRALDAAHRRRSALLQWRTRRRPTRGRRLRDGGPAPGGRRHSARPPDALGNGRRLVRPYAPAAGDARAGPTRARGSAVRRGTQAWRPQARRDTAMGAAPARDRLGAQRGLPEALGEGAWPLLAAAGSLGLPGGGWDRFW
jgi:hypothetical protein